VGEYKYEYKVHGCTFQTDKEATPVSEWLEEGKRRFGPDVKAWRFICPMCGTSYSVEEFIAAGGDGPNSAYQECIGRHKNAGPPTGDNPNGCNWCAYGLFGTAGKGRIILSDGGAAVEVFNFAEEVK